MRYDRGELSRLRDMKTLEGNCIQHGKALDCLSNLPFPCPYSVYPALFLSLSHMQFVLTFHSVESAGSVSFSKFIHVSYLLRDQKSLFCQILVIV